MQRLRRALWLLAASLVVTVVAVGLRALTAAGLFSDVSPQFGGTCRALRGVVGAEDLQVDRQDQLLFVSATDRRALDAHKPNPQDGIHTLSLDNVDAGFSKLAGTPANFHPHGLSLFREANGALTLMVVNHPVAADSSVEIFDVKVQDGEARLTERASITGDLLVSPNDVAAAGPAQFYVTNDGTSKTWLGRVIEALDIQPRANVVYFDGNVFRVVAQDLSFANGIALSADGVHLYVASTTGRAVYTYERNPFSGSLKAAGELAIPSGLDNIDVDGRGNLWVAGHPKLLDMGRLRRDPHATTPSQVFAVTVLNGVPAQAKLVYANRGEEISGSSIGAVADHHLFIGAPLDSRILDCKMD